MTGLEYSTSVEKIQFDERLASFMLPVSRQVARLAISRLPFDEHEGEDGLFRHVRVGANGEEFVIPKLKTMTDPTEESLSDRDLHFCKNNPRIPSGFSRLVRDLAIDELPQIELIPGLSFVGTRTMSEDALDYYLDAAKKVDRGIAEDFEGLYYSPNIRHGLTGRSQLLYTKKDTRTPDDITRSMRADLEYYLIDASFERDFAIISSTPFRLITSFVAKSLKRALTS